jgi:hypothetical protein
MIMTNIDLLNENKEARNIYVKRIFNDGRGPDDDISKTRARINCVMRIVNAGRCIEALEKVIKSDVVAIRSPGAVKFAGKLLMKLSR